MTESKSGDHDDAATHSDVTTDRADRLSPQECHETVDPETREKVLDEYTHRCQVCGREGPAEGGLATLHVHHIERDPDGMGEHDLANLTLLCRLCHSWFHEKSTAADAPVEISEEDQGVLLAQDIEILQYLAENGPARTGDIRAGLWSDHSVSSVRERLWVLMGLDNLVAGRDRQIVDKDVETGEWGLTEQIENSARGHIPDDPQVLLQRMEDEQVRQALDRGCDRSAIVDVLGISQRTTFHKEKRACAYDFPLDAFRRGGRPTGNERSTRSADTPDTPADERKEQQRLGDVPDEEPESRGRTETWGPAESEPEAQSTSAENSRASPLVGDDDEDGELQAHLQQAIEALHEVSEAL